MKTHLRADLLRLVCAQLDVLEADYIRSLDPDCLETHQTAYLALRRTGTKLPAELQEQFLAALLAAMDARLEEEVAQRATHRRQATVSVLRPGQRGQPDREIDQTDDTRSG